jgi:outer membrane receptor protein involved in Fe transport
MSCCATSRASACRISGWRRGERDRDPRVRQWRAWRRPGRRGRRIPLNESNSQSDGYVDINVLVPLEIAALTVYRGPVSALYGNFNRGGLVAFETRKGGDYAEFDVAAGSFRTFDAEAALGLTSRGGQQFNAAAQVFHSDGYRPQSELDRITVAARYAIDLSDAVDVAISGRYNRTRADNAGI